MTRKEAAAFARKLPKTTDTKSLVKKLIGRGTITAYQAEVLAKDKGQSLWLGEYLILDKIGEGGMGQVFMARHHRMKRTVALKLLPAAHTRSRDAIKRFEREVEAAAKLNHPNVVTAYDAGESSGRHFLVMEYVSGLNLSDLVQQSGPLPVA
jgi:serine/threonine protein kinase